MIVINRFLCTPTDHNKMFCESNCRTIKVQQIGFYCVWILKPSEIFDISEG